MNPKDGAYDYFNVAKAYTVDSDIMLHGKDRGFLTALKKAEFWFSE